ncbi:MAG: type I-F CRISPR-associated endonuclease Cas1f [Gallionellaceae bacterium]
MGIDRKKSLAVMMSARANVFYLQHAKVCIDGARVIYWMRDGEIDRAFNIPDKNTAFIMLGKGTSITDAAARKLAESGVLIGFCGSGGSPLFSTVSPVFLEPHSEYRPTDYMQSWVLLWMNEVTRLSAAKFMLRERIRWTTKSWGKSLPDVSIPESMVDRFLSRINGSLDTCNLLSSEAEWAKGVYAILAKKFKLSEFTRKEGIAATSSKCDVINGMIDHGNYIAYGYAASVLTTLGISYAFPLLHGKTRRGALVFDVADLFKDAIVMPLAFECGSSGVTNQEFRYRLIDICWDSGVLDELFDTLK